MKLGPLEIAVTWRGVQTKRSVRRQAARLAQQGNRISAIKYLRAHTPGLTLKAALDEINRLVPPT